MDDPKKSAHRRFSETDFRSQACTAEHKGFAQPRCSSMLGQQVRQRRQARRLSLDRLAAMAGCSKSYLSAIENNRCGPPGLEILRKLEAALEVQEGELIRLAALEATPDDIRQELEALQRKEAAAARMAELLRSFKSSMNEKGDAVSSLDEAFRSGELRKLIDAMSPEEERSPVPVSLPVEVPLINKVAAGYPREFTDLGYPARCADEYIRCPDLADPDAFAARVIGDSMQPEYREGDIVIFSPARDITNGSDCFARIAPDDETTFKRVFFETGERGQEMIRLQPLNPAYPPRTLEREEVLGLFAAVSVLRTIRTP